MLTKSRPPTPNSSRQKLPDKARQPATTATTTSEGIWPAKEAAHASVALAVSSTTHDDNTKLPPGPAVAAAAAAADADAAAAALNKKRQAELEKELKDIVARHEKELELLRNNLMEEITSQETFICSHYDEWLKMAKQHAMDMKDKTTKKNEELQKKHWLEASEHEKEMDLLRKKLEDQATNYTVLRSDVQVRSERQSYSISQLALEIARRAHSERTLLTENQMLAHRLDNLNKYCAEQDKALWMIQGENNKLNCQLSILNAHTEIRLHCIGDLQLQLHLRQQKFERCKLALYALGAMLLLVVIRWWSMH